MAEEKRIAEIPQGDVPASGLDQLAVQELVGYIMGATSEPPKALDKMMTNLYQKLQLGLGYSVASNVQRQTKLVKFIATVEDELFDPEQVATMDKGELQELYKNATKALGEMNEFERRFLAQNKDTLSGHKTEQEKLAQQLMTLSPEKIESIMKIVKGETLIEQNSSDEGSTEDILGDL